MPFPPPPPRPACAEGGDAVCGSSPRPLLCVRIPSHFVLSLLEKMAASKPSKTFRLEGKVIVVTASTDGIGAKPVEGLG